MRLLRVVGSRQAGACAQKLRNKSDTMRMIKFRPPSIFSSPYSAALDVAAGTFNAADDLRTCHSGINSSTPASPTPPSPTASASASTNTGRPEFALLAEKISSRFERTLSRLSLMIATPCGSGDNHCTSPTSVPIDPLHRPSTHIAWITKRKASIRGRCQRQFVPTEAAKGDEGSDKPTWSGEVSPMVFPR